MCIPLYDNWSLVSAVEDFGTGVMIPIFHIFGIFPREKHLLYKTQRVCRMFLHFKTSIGISSIPVALFDFIRFNADSISVICIGSCR